MLTKKALVGVHLIEARRILAMWLLILVLVGMPSQGVPIQFFCTCELHTLHVDSSYIVEF